MVACHKCVMLVVAVVVSASICIDWYRNRWWRWLMKPVCLCTYRIPNCVCTGVDLIISTYILSGLGKTKIFLKGKKHWATCLLNETLKWNGQASNPCAWHVAYVRVAGVGQARFVSFLAHSPLDPPLQVCKCLIPLSPCFESWPTNTAIESKLFVCSFWTVTYIERITIANMLPKYLWNIEVKLISDSEIVLIRYVIQLPFAGLDLKPTLIDSKDIN